MPANDPYHSAPADLAIGDQSLLSLTLGCTKTIAKGDRLDTMKQISWAIRYAYICGCQRGAAEANATMDAILKRISPEAGLPGPEDGLPPIETQAKGARS